MGSPTLGINGIKDGNIFLMSACGILAMFLLRPTPWVERAEDVSFLGTMRGCWRLFCSPNMLVLCVTLLFTGTVQYSTVQYMLVLCVTLLFTGLNQSLWAGIYSGCIGFTKGYAVDIFIYLINLST